MPARTEVLRGSQFQSGAFTYFLLKGPCNPKKTELNPADFGRARFAQNVENSVFEYTSMTMATMPKGQSALPIRPAM